MEFCVSGFEWKSDGLRGAYESGYTVTKPKTETTPSMSRKKSRFDEIVTALPEMGLEESQLENMNRISSEELFNDNPSSQLVDNLQANLELLLKELGRFRDFYGDLSNLFATALVKAESSLDEYDMLLTKLARNIGFSTSAVSDAGFVSIWEAIKEMQDQAGNIRLMAEMGQVEAQLASIEAANALIASKISDISTLKKEFTAYIDSLVAALQKELDPPLIARAESLYTLLSGTAVNPPPIAFESRVKALETLNSSAGGVSPSGVSCGFSLVTGPPIPTPRGCFI